MHAHASVYLLMFTKLLFRFSPPYRRCFLYDCFLHAPIGFLVSLPALTRCHTCSLRILVFFLSACTVWTLSKWMCRACLWFAGQSLSAAPLCQNSVLPVFIGNHLLRLAVRLQTFQRELAQLFCPVDPFVAPNPFFLLVNGDTTCSWLNLLPILHF